MTTTQAPTERDAAAKKAPRFDHAYAIVRVDEFLGAHVPAKDKVTVKKVMWDASAAEAEVARLNNLQGEGVHYFVQVTRLEKRVPTAPLPEEDGGQRAESEHMPPHSNRINRIADSSGSGDSGAPSDANLVWMDDIQIPDYIWLDPPRGFGFPARRVFDACATPTQVHAIRWKDLSATIYSKSSPQHTDLVCLWDHEQKKPVEFAFRAFPDLCEMPLTDLTPLSLVEQFVERFGLTIHAGTASAKLFYEKEIPKTRLLLAGQPEGATIWGEGPKEGFLVRACFKEEQTLIRIALAFGVNIMDYWRWVSGH